MKIKLTFLMLFLSTQFAFSQHNNSELPTSINDNGAAPDASAILDVQSTDKGVLIPRMTDAQMFGISSPVAGLLIYNTTNGSFYYHDGTGWISLSGGSGGGPSNRIEDSDNDTRVDTEGTFDDDIIRFTVEGTQELLMTNNLDGQSRLDFQGDHIMIGDLAGENVVNGLGGIYLGEKAGANASGGFHNIMIGHETGLVHGSGYNTMIGFQSGKASTSGSNNVFLGAQTGFSNTNKSGNVYIGRQAGYGNNGENNTFLGHLAGAGASANFATADNCVYIGHKAGINNLTDQRLFIGDSDFAPSLIYGEFDNDILRVNGTFEVNDPTISGYSLPAVDGASGQVLTTNGAGSASWATDTDSDPNNEIELPIGGLNGDVLQTNGSGTYSWATPTGSPWDYNAAGNDIYTTTNFVGIGTTNPGAVLEVSTGSAQAKSILVNNTNVNGTGVLVDMDASAQNNANVKGVLSKAQPKAYAGYFEGRLETTTVLNLEEKTSAPANSDSYAGDIYMDNGNNTDSGNRGLRYHDGTNWEDVVEPTIAFRGRITANVSVPNFTYTVMDGFFEQLDEGNNFNPTTGEFTAPSDGVYQFNIKPQWGTTSTFSDIIFAIQLKVNGTTQEQHTYVSSLLPNFGIGDFFAPVVELSANDVVTVEVMQRTGVSINLSGGGGSGATSLAGFKIK